MSILNPMIPLRWAWSHKLKACGIVGLCLIAVYALIFVIVENWPATTTDTVVIHDDLTMGYIEWEGPVADGSSVILVHGTPADASSWLMFSRRMNELKARRILAIDRLGFGNSSPGTYDKLSDHSQAIYSFMAAKQVPRPILVGHSYGGPAVLRAAVDYGDELAGIIIMAGACDPYMDDPKWFRGSVDFISPILPTSWAVANRELFWLNRENQEMESLLKNVRCPVYIIHGTWDPVCPFDSTVSYLQNGLTNAERIVVHKKDGYGHNVQFHAIDELIESINEINELL